MKIKELYSDASKWTKHEFARSNTGTPLPSFAPDATSWCLIGAINKCYSGKEDFTKVYESVRAHMPLVNGIAMISNWNDSPTRTFDEIKALVEKLDI